MAMVLFISIVSILLVISYFVISYSVGDLAFGNQLDVAEKLLVGFALLSSVLVIFAFFLSYLTLLNPIASTVLLFGAYLIVLNGSYRTGWRSFRSLKSSIRRRSDLRVALFAVIALYILCMIFESHSFLPQGWDRGSHFADYIYILLNGGIYNQYPGTDYNAFYLPGTTFLLSVMSMTIGQLCGVNPALVANDLTFFGVPFEFTWAMLVSVWPLVPYALVKRFTLNKKIALFSAILPLTIAGTELARMGSIGTSFGYFLAMVIFMLVSLRAQRLISGNRVSLSIALIIGCIVAVHIIPIIFIIFMLGFFYLVQILSRRLEWREVVSRIIETGLGGLIGFLVVFLLANSLFWGIFDEAARKTSNGVAISPIEGYQQYLWTQIGGLEFALDPVIIPLVIIGAYCALKVRSILSLSVTCVVFFILPLVGFPRAIYYLMTPLMLLAAFGLRYLSDSIMLHNGILERMHRSYRQALGIFVVGLVIVPPLIIQVSVVMNPGPYIIVSELDESTNHPLEMASWFNTNIPSSLVVSFPSSGAVGRLFATLIENKVYFAERRYSDLPQYQDIASIYDLGHTWQERISVIQEYNISVIVEGFSYRLLNVTQWEIEFPDMVTYSLFEDYYIVRVLAGN